MVLETNEEFPAGSKLKKLAVIGFATCVVPDHEFSKNRIVLRPLCFSWQGDATSRVRGNDSLPRDGSIMSVVPAPPGTFEVVGMLKEGYLVHLGYEYPGIEHPDWEDVLEKEETRSKHGSC